MGHSNLHKDVYDRLADEYEGRVGALMAVTQEAMDYFSSHIKPAGTVLDVGCGVGAAMNVLAQKGFIVSGIDISPKMLRFAKARNPGAKVIVGDFLETEFNNKFDAILTFAFVHLFPKAEVKQIFEKIRSILNPNGVALISSTESLESKEGVFSKDDFGEKHKRFRKYWTEQELRDSLNLAGFKELALKKYVDHFGKIWMDFVVQK